MTNNHFPSSEYRLLDELAKVLGPFALPDGTYPLTLGDDAAIRCSPGAGERTVITTDIAVENVHFKTAYMTFREIGFKIMAANVSDCAAMAARPEAALVNLVFPALDDETLRNCAIDLYKGFAEACEKWNFKVIGGDLASGCIWTIGITMIGKAPQNGRLLTRRGIAAGDRLWTASFPGQSAAGFAALTKWGCDDVPSQYRRLVARHVRPEPNVDMGVRFGECPEIHAMMDLSDGISKDGRTLCYDNDLGLEIDIDALVPPEEMLSLAHALGVPVADWILHGGEEYALLFACEPDFNPAQVFADVRCTAIGIFTSSHRAIIVRSGGTVAEVPHGSWDHLRRKAKGLR